MPGSQTEHKANKHTVTCTRELAMYKYIYTDPALRIGRKTTWIGKGIIYTSTLSKQSECKIKSLAKRLPSHKCLDTLRLTKEARMPWVKTDLQVECLQKQT